MSLLRFLGRSLFASAFIADGVKKVSSPAAFAPEAEAFTSKVSPMIQRALPAEYSSRIPEESETWVRLAGALQVAGGAMFATGIFRRLGAFLLIPAGVLNVAIAWPAKDASAEAKKEARSRALTQAALLGAAIVATQDLQGKPGLGWRAEHGAKALGNKAGKLSAKAQKRAEKAVKLANKRVEKLNKKLASVTN